MTSKYNELFSGGQLWQDGMNFYFGQCFSIIMQSLANDNRNILMIETVTVPKILEIHSSLT